MITMRTAIRFLLTTAVGTLAASARADDAYDQLKQGYALKQAGNCREALPHFSLSLQLNPTPKAALNLADCEARTGDLVAAQGHAAEGRRLAHERNDTELETVAEQQLVDVEKRLPHLTIKLAPSAPPDSHVSLDGRPLEARSLAVAMPVNPGTHRVVVIASGHRNFAGDLRLDEGAVQVLEVAPGAPIEPIEPVLRSNLKPGLEASDVGVSSVLDSRKLVALGVGGLGLVGLIVGIGAGLVANSKHDTLQGECPGNNCQSSAQGDLDGFHSLKTASTVAYVAALSGIAGGAALWLTAPRTSARKPAARLWIGAASAGIAGSF
jgi:hypothetical protein